MFYCTVLYSTLLYYTIPCYTRYTISSIPYTTCYLLYTAYGILYTIHSTLYRIHQTRIPYTLYIIHCTVLYSARVWYTIRYYTVYYTVYTILDGTLVCHTVYMYIHTHIHIEIYAYAHTKIHTHMCVRIYKNAHIHAYRVHRFGSGSGHIRLAWACSRGLTGARGEAHGSSRPFLHGVGCFLG